MTHPTLVITPDDSTGPDDLSPLLNDPFAQALAEPAAGIAARLSERLCQRLDRSLQAEQGMVTVRRPRGAALASAAVPPEGLRTLYRAPLGRRLRPGEPRQVALITLPAGAELGLDPAEGPREFLVMGGQVEVDAQLLGLHDFLLLPAGGALRLRSAEGAQVFMREADATVPVTEPALVRDADAGWPDFAPGIRRRVLWAGGGQAALLYRAEAGAQVPDHSHGHDEECFMVAGELFLDDVLLQQGDYQLAPAGTGHRITETDTGVVLYAHGDLDLRFT